MLEAFSLERVGRSGAVFDPAKLRWVNSQLLHHADAPRLIEWGGAFLPAAAKALPRERLEREVALVRGNLETLADLPRELEPLLAGGAATEDDARAVLGAPAARELCAALAAELATLAPWSAAGFKSALQALGARLGVGGRDLFQPVRAALTGRTHGPELPLIAETLGRDACLERLRAAAAGPRTSEDGPT
jgi:nondiscriminating glutamyl-tRNA synthetase